MKKCSDCGVEVIENCRINAEKAFEVGMDRSVDIRFVMPTGKKGSFLGYMC